MANTLEGAEEIVDYGSTHGMDLVVPLAILDRTYHPTSSKPPSSSRPPSWKTKKIKLGLIMGLTAVVVVAARATVFVSVLRDPSSADPPAARTGPESVLLQRYPYVTITNKTPFQVVSAGVRVRANYSVSYLGETLPYGCRPDYMYDGLGAGETWTAPSRGLCLVKTIRATLWYYTEERGSYSVECAPYSSSGTSHSKYSILMKGDEHACCIRSSHESQRCEGDYLPARHPYSINP